MRIGKLDWCELEKIINKNKGAYRQDVRIRSGIGEDCSVINFGEYECVLSTDPITGAEKNIGKLAFHINCNDIASCGVDPMGILVTILAPPSATIQDIENIMMEIDCESRKFDIEILGGHTEITDSVNRIIVSCTVIGKTKVGKSISTSGAKVGDDIIVTKKLCLEGTSIIINDYYEIIKKFLSEEEIKEAKSYINQISVVKEGKIGGEFGVSSMHDITEGGVLGALWEVAEGSGMGFKIYKDKLPISDVTKKICSILSIDPLKLISSGSMLITSKNGLELINILKQKGIEATIIGNITGKGKILIDKNGENEVLPPKKDELFNINIIEKNDKEP